MSNGDPWPCVECNIDMRNDKRDKTHLSDYSRGLFGWKCHDCAKEYFQYFNAYVPKEEED